mmetsp:Transcript_7225/g.22169  ORF Transcript_7225/g.22169 Transcript_7225/m.22169 type:complete len:249 (-) Transcript_7225:1994-2740(-)
MIAAHVECRELELQLAGAQVVRAVQEEVGGAAQIALGQTELAGVQQDLRDDVRHVDHLVHLAQLQVGLQHVAVDAHGASGVVALSGDCRHAREQATARLLAPQLEHAGARAHGQHRVAVLVVLEQHLAVLQEGAGAQLRQQVGQVVVHCAHRAGGAGRARRVVGERCARPPPLQVRLRHLLGQHRVRVRQQVDRLEEELLGQLVVALRQPRVITQHVGRLRLGEAVRQLRVQLGERSHALRRIQDLVL